MPEIRTSKVERRRFRDLFQAEVFNFDSPDGPWVAAQGINWLFHASG